MLFLARCDICGRHGSSPCAACIAELQPPVGLVCPRSLDSCVGAVSYAGGGAALVRALKFGNSKRALAWMATAIAHLATREVEVVTWIPTSVRRRRARGFDQAELLATRVGRRLGLPTLGLLSPANGGHQTGRSAIERWESVAFGSRRRVAQPVLLIDDVLTTGASLSAAAEALRRGGATAVHGAVFAFTPPPTARSTGAPARPRGAETP